MLMTGRMKTGGGIGGKRKSSPGSRLLPKLVDGALETDSDFRSFLGFDEPVVLRGVDFSFFAPLSVDDWVAPCVPIVRKPLKGEPQ
jgi:hypothetical protein